MTPGLLATGETSGFEKPPTWATFPSASKGLLLLPAQRSDMAIVVLVPSRPRVYHREQSDPVVQSVHRRERTGPGGMTGKEIINVVIVLQGQSQLFEVVFALRPAGGLPRLLNGPQQEGHQHRDNGNHDQ